MVYRINKTDGTEIAQIPDGKFDQTTTLTLFGKNVTSFGEGINENFVKLLENFASASQPQRSVRGQLWYDTSTGRLKIYDGTGYRVAGGPIVSPSIEGINLVQGDLWIHNENNQIYFYDGTDLVLVGPGYSSVQGVTGFKAETLIDRVNGQSRHVAALYVSDILLGIFSASNFTPLVQLPGYGDANKPIIRGFNVAGDVDFAFDVTATRSRSLVLNSGIVKTAEEVAYKNLENIFTQPISILSSQPLSIGSSGQIRLNVIENDGIIQNVISNRNIFINIKQNDVNYSAITLHGARRQIGLWNDNPAYDVDINGTLHVSGDLIVGGESVTLNTTVLATEDKNIELNKSDNPGSMTDLTANNGGIILKATTDKTILYDSTNQSWDVSENLNLAQGKKFKINDIVVLEEDPDQNTYPNEYALGVNVTSAPGLVRVGNLTDLNAGQLALTTNRISTPPNTNLELNMPGVGNLTFIDGGQIKGIDAPIDYQDATNKLYVDTKAFTRPISFSMDITGYTLFTGDDDNAAISAILDIISPYYDLTNPSATPNGTAAAGCRLILHTTRISIVNQGYSLPPTAYNYSYEQVISQDGTSLVGVLSDVTINPFPAPTPIITITRREKLFIMGGGTNPQIGKWGFDSDLSQPYTTTV
jgi:hypothetical protein